METAPPKGIYMRTSVVDLMPDPLSPLFASLGIPAMVAQMYPLGKYLTRMRARSAGGLFHHDQWVCLHERPLSGAGLVVDSVRHAASIPAHAAHAGSVLA